jgi:hypothetical protein
MRVDGPLLNKLLATVRARFRYIVLDSGVQWLYGDLVAAVPIQRAIAFCSFRRQTWLAPNAPAEPWTRSIDTWMQKT